MSDSQDSARSTEALGEIEALQEHAQKLDGRIGELDRKTALIISSIRSLVSAADVDVDDDDSPLAEMRSQADQLGDDIGDLQTAVESHGDTLASIADVGEDKTNEAEKISAIVAYADQASGQSSKALVTPKEIAGATGCSKRYAYDLVDKIGGLDEGGGYDDGTHPWAAVRETETVTTGNGSETKPKGLKIDFDRVQQDPDALNWFNNGNGGNGTQ